VLVHLVGVESGDILDQRGLDGSGIVALFKNGARKRFDVPRLFANDPRRLVAARSGDDLGSVRRSIASDQRCQLNFERA